MSMDTIETGQHNTGSVARRVANGARQAFHLSHQACAVKSLAQDAIEDRVHEVRRATEKRVRRAIERLEDIKEDTARYVKRQPLKTVAIGAGVAWIVGLATGWTAMRVISDRRHS